MIRAACACLLLVGCVQPVIPTPPEPTEAPIAQCEAVCWVPCDVSGIAFAPAPETTDAVDDLVQQVVIPLRGRIDQCEVSRLACQHCIDRLRKAGVVR